MSIHAAKRWIWVTNCANFGGNEPPFGKILASDLGIQGVYVNGTPGEDRFVTPALMQRIRSFGLLAGCWFVPRSLGAVEAQKAAAMVDALNPDCVMLDVETHDLAFQRALIAEYRRLKPGRATDWTFEPRQSTETVALNELLAARMDIFPQLYDKNMRPADPKHELFYWRQALADRVFEKPEARLHLFLDARSDWWWLDDGALFTAETLPDRRSIPQRVVAWRFKDTTEARLLAGVTPVVPCGEEPEELAA